MVGTVFARSLITISDTVTLFNGPPGSVGLGARVIYDEWAGDGMLRRTFQVPSTVRFDQPFEVRAEFDIWTREGLIGAIGIETLDLADSQGQPISGYTYSSRLGSRYPFQGGKFVPEPALGSCVAIALAGILVAAAWKKRQPGTSLTALVTPA